VNVDGDDVQGESLDLCEEAVSVQGVIPEPREGRDDAREGVIIVDRVHRFPRGAAIDLYVDGTRVGVGVTFLHEGSYEGRVEATFVREESDEASVMTMFVREESDEACVVTTGIGEGGDDACVETMGIREGSDNACVVTTGIR
jgi:hypothetical protein